MLSTNESGLTYGLEIDDGTGKAAVKIWISDDGGRGLGECQTGVGGWAGAQSACEPPVLLDCALPCCDAKHQGLLGGMLRLSPSLFVSALPLPPHEQTASLTSSGAPSGAPAATCACTASSPTLVGACHVLLPPSQPHGADSQLTGAKDRRC